VLKYEDSIFKVLNMKKAAIFMGCVFLTLLTGGVSGYLTAPEIESWYAGLNKPVFNPPNYLFGPVWTLLYIMMGVSFFIILQTATNNKGRCITVFAVQLILNFLWSIIFFNFHDIFFALFDIALLWASILVMILVFYKENKIAALLQVPYLLWVTFATALNIAILFLN